MDALSHLYISPLELCNLSCKICYTKKTPLILQKEDIVDFIRKYKKVRKLETVTFCGGEVFTLNYFTDLVNLLNESGLFIQIISNGTIDKLSEIHTPNSVNLIVSFDGFEKYLGLNVVHPK